MFICVSIWAYVQMWVHVPVKARRGRHIPLSWSYRLLWTWLLELNSPPHDWTDGTLEEELPHQNLWSSFNVGLNGADRNSSTQDATAEGCSLTPTWLIQWDPCSEEHHTNTWRLVVKGERLSQSPMGNERNTDVQIVCSDTLQLFDLEPGLGVCQSSMKKYHGIPNWSLDREIPPLCKHQLIPKNSLSVFLG